MFKIEGFTLGGEFSHLCNGIINTDRYHANKGENVKKSGKGQKTPPDILDGVTN
jgi:hypothetical protein